MRIAVILHNIRSLHNVGSIFRTADGAGAEKIYLCGITPAPIDRFGNIRKEIAKVALGAERAVPWEKAGSTLSLVRKLQKGGWDILAVEQSPRARPYTEAARMYTVLRSENGVQKKEKKTAVVLGAEVRGLPPSVLRAADMILEIPMYGKKESLNVSVAAGIILFTLRG